MVFFFMNKLFWKQTILNRSFEQSEKKIKESY